MSTLLLCLNLAVAQDNSWTSGRPDGHAPINVMGDHYHAKGEMMFSYRLMPMWMEGNLSGSSEISDESIFEDYMVAPQRMQMNMHMLGAMYAVSDRFTLMLMGNYVTNTMDLKTRMGMDFTTESGGFGDFSIGGLFQLMNKNRQSIHANLALSIPAGDIDQRDDTPMMDNAQLAYPMQLGSGTFDPSFGLTYLGQSDMISWGAQSLYKLRLSQNSEDYSFGNQLNSVSWGAVRLSEQVSVSTSISYFNAQSIDGSDADLDPMMMPLFNSVNSGRQQLDLGIGSNFYVSKGTWKNVRIGVEARIPIYQSVNGIQMRNAILTTFGIQYSLSTRN